MQETDEEEQAMTIRLPKGTHRTLRILSATTGVAMNTMINEAVGEWLARRDQGQEGDDR